MATASTLTELLERGPVARLVGARDPLTAILAERAGFDGVWVSSLEASATRGLPDLGLLTSTECLADARAITETVAIPALVDCDTGYGGAVNVRRTVQDFAAAGIPGVCIEDKVFPKRNSFLDGPQELLPKDEFAHIVATAVRTRGGSDMAIVARTESFVAGRVLDEALDRAHAYADAGADAVLVHSNATDHQEVAGFLEKWDKRLPVVIVPTTYSRWTAAEAEDAGASIIVYANHAIRASISAMGAAFSLILRDGCSARVDNNIADIEELLALTGTSRWEDGS